MCEKSTTDRIHYTRLVIEAAASRMSFKASICDAARHALAILCHEEDDQMDHS
jgi:hypothetical protein